MAGTSIRPTAFAQPTAAWRVFLGEQDLTDKIDLRLISLSISERRGEAADSLTIAIHDHDGAMALPSKGAVLSVEIGWERGAGVPIGMWKRGTYKVDSIEWEGPPDMISITAHSADLTAEFKRRRNTTYHSATLGSVTDQIAQRAGLTARCHPDLASQVVDHAEQANQSDMEFLRDLARRYDAVATVKAAALILAPVEATTTATGAAIPSFTLTRADGDKYAYREDAREGGSDGAEAQYQDPDTGQRQTVGTGGSNPKRVKRVHHSKASAHISATSEAKRIARAGASFETTLAYGRPDLAVGQRVALSGYKAAIDAQGWLIASVEQSIKPESGYRTTLTLERVKG